MSFIFIAMFLGGIISWINNSFANNDCPKIEIDPTTKKISVITCDEITKGKDTSTEKQNNTKLKEKKEEVKKEAKKEKNKEPQKIGDFTRISKSEKCPQIFVNDTTKDIKVVKCGEKLKVPKSQNNITQNSSGWQTGEVKNLDSSAKPQNDTNSGWQKNNKKEEKKEIPPASNKPEFDQALAWMYTNGITKFNTKKTYRPNDPLSREEAAKMFGKVYQVLGYNINVIKNKQCEFSDEAEFTLDLAKHITDVCHWGLFQGANGKFDAKKSLTKAQATAVLVRILEWKLSYEKLTPWWTNYYQKAFLLGITKVDNINVYDKIQNRKEIALMLWRFKQIVENKNKNTWLKQIKKIDWKTGSQLNLDNWEQDLDKVLWDINFEKDPELIEAVRWMYDQGLTKFQDIKKYQPEEILTRGQAAKIFDVFSTALGRKTDDGLLPNACVFNDISQLSKESILHIQNVCKKGLLHWKNGKFDPKWEMLKSQFMVILVRLFDDKKINTAPTTPWWKGYFERARELGLVDISDVNSFDKVIRRYEVALFLYRFNVRYNIVNNINTSTINKQLITTIEKTEIIKDKKKQIDAYIDMSLFQHDDLELAYVYFFDTRYKVVKSLRREYINNSFVRYGDVFDLVDNKKLGTINLIIRNDKLISWVIRISEKNYLLKKKDWIEAYFTVSEQ